MDAPRTPQGPLAENLLLALLLLADLLSNPFHWVGYLAQRSRIRRALQRALSESAS